LFLKRLKEVLKEVLKEILKKFESRFSRCDAEPRDNNLRDRAWIRLMLSGDKWAGEQFVAAYYVRIERLLRCLTGSPDVARDLTQQTFVKAWQALPGFKFEASLATWLHRIAYHEYTHWLRDRRDHAPLEAARNVPGQQMINDWGIVLLPDALAQLSDELREAFLLYYVQELSVTEVAGVLNVPRGTIKSRLFTARQKLRGILQQAMHDSGPDTRTERTASSVTERPTAPIPEEYRVECRINPTPKGKLAPLSHALTPGDVSVQEVKGGLSR
jgi:RNA polymerase sigma-70 factor (ECF subfamily)